MHPSCSPLSPPLLQTDFDYNLNNNAYYFNDSFTENSDFFSVLEDNESGGINDDILKYLNNDDVTLDIAAQFVETISDASEEDLQKECEFSENEEMLYNSKDELVIQESSLLQENNEEFWICDDQKSLSSKHPTRKKRGRPRMHHDMKKQKKISNCDVSNCIPMTYVNGFLFMTLLSAFHFIFF